MLSQCTHRLLLLLSAPLLLFFFSSSSLSVADARPQPRPPGPRPHHGPPAFLRNVSSEARRQFFLIAGNLNGTKAQILDQLSQWAQTNGVSDQYQNYTGESEKRDQRMHDSLVQWLAGRALELFNSLWSIRQNMQLTRPQECQQIRQAINGTEPMLRRLVPIPPPIIPGPPPRRCLFFPPPRPQKGPGGGGSGSSEVSNSAVPDDDDF